MFPMNLNAIKSLQDVELLKALRRSPDAPKNYGKPIVSAVKDEKMTLYIYDVIGWPFIEAQDIVNAVPEDIKEIDLRINSPGGSVFEGTAIYNWLSGHGAKINVFVDGVAASMGSVLAMLGDGPATIHDSAFIMIHDPWVVISGNAAELIKEAELLEKIEETMAAIYAKKTGADMATIRQWMHDEKWFKGSEAVESGFAGKVEKSASPANAIQFDLSLFGKAPSGAMPLKRAAAARIPKPTEVKPMNAELKKKLVARGLAADATDEQALAFLQSELDKGAVDLPDVNAVAKEAAQTEKKRQAEIRRYVAVSGLPDADAFAQKLIDEDVPVGAIGEKIFAAMEKANPPIGPGRIEMGTTEGEKFKSAATDALLIRTGQKIDKPAPGASDLAGYEMTSIVRDSLARSGMNVSGLNSRIAIADFVFRSRQGSMTTSDFTEIFRDAANKVLQRRYAEAPATWRAWCNVTTTSDFKDKHVAALSEGPELLMVKEAAEYTYGKMLEKGEKYSPDKYGRMIKLTWEMMVNDDLGAFVREAGFLGNASGRLENKVVYDLLTSGSSNHGPTLNATSRQLFNSTEANILTTGRAITATNLDAARQLMRGQKSLQGNYLNIEPRFLIISPKNEMTLDVLLTSAGSTTDSKNAGVTNPMQGRFQSIVESYLLDKFSGLGWYMLADPSQIDTFEVSFLSGYTSPTISEREGWETDTIEWKVRHVFGVGAIDHRGMVLNDGSA